MPPIRTYEKSLNLEKALIHRSLPVEELLGMICHNETVCSDIENLLSPRSLDFKVYECPE